MTMRTETDHEASGLRNTVGSNKSGWGICSLNDVTKIYSCGNELWMLRTVLKETSWSSIFYQISLDYIQTRLLGTFPSTKKINVCCYDIQLSAL